MSTYQCDLLVEGDPRITQYRSEMFNGRRYVPNFRVELMTQVMRHRELGTKMFVTHNDPVYPGMIVGLSPKPGDMIINVMKGKKLTNMRTQGTDENVVLTPVRKMSIAEQLSMLNTDEALEITPESCRLRKSILDPHERKKSEKSGAAA